MSSAEVASLLRAREVDIGIDLAGHTLGARPDLFAMRVAPVQVNYLGFPGSSGLDFMDFIIADETVVPGGDESLYTERVARMPHSYLPFDCSRPAAGGGASRASAELPPHGFVFCGFSTSYKISREIFDTWMALLRDVPDSVLWLRRMDAVASENLRSAAALQSVCADRLVFAPFEPNMEAHLTRLALADLFLDTLPYNAHTTAIEALWAGVPVISCRGNKFAGRVGASVLAAAGLPELICSDLTGYRRLAADLAASPGRLLETRARVEQARGTAPLFDTKRYTRDFEEILLGATRRGRS
jgi:predicted O-linked N-acetylglucosamine transferase (SPINDLY family)